MFLELADRRIGGNHLFKRSVLLIKVGLRFLCLGSSLSLSFLSVSSLSFLKRCCSPLLSLLLRDELPYDLLSFFSLQFYESCILLFPWRTM